MKYAVHIAFTFLFLVCTLGLSHAGYVNIIGAPVSLTTDVIGTLPVANGGTGLAAITANSVMVGTGTSAVTLIGTGSTGCVLTWSGSAWSCASSTTTTYVPTIAGCTAASVAFRYLAIPGTDTTCVSGTFECGSPSANPVSFTLPGGDTIASAKLASFGAAAPLRGTAHTTSSGGAGGVFAAGNGLKPHADSTDYTKVYLASNNAADAGTTVVAPKANGSSLFNAGANVYVDFCYPK